MVTTISGTDNVFLNIKNINTTKQHKARKLLSAKRGKEGLQS